MSTSSGMVLRDNNQISQNQEGVSYLNKKKKQNQQICFFMSKTKPTNHN